MATAEVIANKFISIVVNPQNGGTIEHIGKSLDPETNVLAWYEWDEPAALPLEFSANESAKHWLSRYRGGWQFLTPNAGRECVFNGVRHSFHGESSYMPWTVAAKTSESITLEIRLLSGLKVTRVLTVDSSKAAFTCHTTLSNFTNAPEEVVIVEHAAFQGSPNVVVSAPDRSQWKFDGDYKEDGRDSRVWSEPGVIVNDLAHPIKGRTERMTYLASGSEGWVSIIDTDKGFGAKLLWDPIKLPYLWYWQEQGSSGFPFYGRAQMTALEPASCLPGDGLAGASEGGRSTIIASGEEYAFSVSLELI